MELWKKENLKYIIPASITLLLGLLWGSAKNELPVFLGKLFQNISPQLVSAIAISGYLLAILIGWIALQLLSENKKLKSEPEFITRFNLNWKKTQNKIDPHPYCISCSTPHPLLITEYKIGGNPNAEHLKCIHKQIPHTVQWDGYDHWAQKNQKAISYKQAYKEVCEEFNIKPTLINKLD